MRLAVLCAVFLLYFCAPAAAQTAQPTPSPAPTPDGDVVKITTSLIQLDVTVTDKDGRVVRNIKPEEVEVYENGQKQTITSFSFFSNAKADEQTVVTKSDNTPPLSVQPPKVAHRLLRSLSMISIFQVRAWGGSGKL
jgi:hypothetical protein